MIQRNEFKRGSRSSSAGSSAKTSSFRRMIQSILGGGFLTKDGVVNQLPFLFYATFLAILYIANIYYAEKDIREFNALKKELKELRYEYITSKSSLMNISKQSEIAKRLLGSGIKESVVPPYKLVLVKSEPQN